jgi:rhodanese-related sulfurtransferase
LKTTARELVERAQAEVRSLGVDELRALLDTDAGLLLVDLREPDEIATAGTIPGALCVPRGLLEFRADPTSPWADAALAQATGCVLFCGIGWRSALAAKALQDMGRTGVSHLAGGFEAWRAAGAPVQPPTPQDMT